METINDINNKKKSLPWWRFKLHITGGLRGHHISCAQKADVALFWSCALRFRAVIIVSVSTSEKKPHASASFFFSLCFVWPWIRYLSGCFEHLQFGKVFFSTMGDFEAPESNRPRRTVLLSVLPSKEFATSRKGMLLVGEVVRNHVRNRFWKTSNCYCVTVPRILPKSTRKRFARFYQSLSNCLNTALVSLHIFKLNRFLNIGQSFPVRRFLLVKGGAVMLHT